VQVQAAGPQALITELHFDLREIGMEQKNGHWLGTLRVVFSQLNSQEEIVQANDKTFRLDLAPAMYDRLLRDGMLDSKRLQMLPDATQLSIVVRDGSNGNVGSISIPVAKYLSSRTNAIH
jgi:hypothetical protein